MRYMLMFRGDDGLLHRDEVVAASDPEATKRAINLHPNSEWILTRKVGSNGQRATKTIASHTPEEKYQ